MQLLNVPFLIVERFLLQQSYVGTPLGCLAQQCQDGNERQTPHNHNNCNKISQTTVGRTACTVNKLRSLNLLFFSMFRIEHKIVHVGTEKIIKLY
jgi:hypothetical protein